MSVQSQEATNIRELANHLNKNFIIEKAKDLRHIIDSKHEESIKNKLLDRCHHLCVLDVVKKTDEILCKNQTNDDTHNVFPTLSRDESSYVYSKITRDPSKRFSSNHHPIKSRKSIGSKGLDSLPKILDHSQTNQTSNKKLISETNHYLSDNTAIHNTIIWRRLIRVIRGVKAVGELSPVTSNGKSQQININQTRTTINKDNEVNILEKTVLKSLSNVTKTSLAIDYTKIANVLAAPKLGNVAPMRGTTSDLYIPLDISRLYFVAGVLFNENHINDRSVICFEKAAFASLQLCNESTSELQVIVEHYDTLFSSDEYQRKLCHASHMIKEKLRLARSDEMAVLISREYERQLLVGLVSHIQLFRIYLLKNQSEKAARAFEVIDKRIIVDAIISETERIVIMTICHNLLKAFSGSHKEVSKEEQIILGSAGRLAETHINVLLYLFKQEMLDNETKEDVTEWLGIRYAEKLDFNTSRNYYQIFRENAVHSIPRDELRLRQRNVSHHANDIDAAESSDVKCPLHSYECGSNGDRRMIGQGIDFTGFIGVHTNSSTVVYRVPMNGWNENGS